ncbi:MAG TPA: hypothetical protein VJ742_02310 [Nitrososphaera sp.]|nr:hypothetical protein [Nitrososphaera sp.]
MPCKLELFPQTTSVTYLRKLMTFPIVLSIIMACFSVGITDAFNNVSSEVDTLQRLSSTTGNFVGPAVYGMMIFILPFGLGGLGVGYVIEHEGHRKNRAAGVGFVSGVFLGFVILFEFIVAPFSSNPTIVAAGFGAVAGFVLGIIVSSTQLSFRVFSGAESKANER